jgi:lysozyme
MSWLKLTSKALYLMKGETENYIDKVELECNSSGAFTLFIPPQWFKDNDAPSGMIIQMLPNFNVEEPKPLTNDKNKVINQVIGIDVSNHNPSIDWSIVKNSGIYFAFIKATEGASFVDPTFATNWSKLKTVGILRGAYHFFRPTKDPLVQANNFIQTVSNVLESDDLPPVLDVEKTKEDYDAEEKGKPGPWLNISLSERLDRVKKWLDAVEKVTYKKPIIYTSPAFWQEVMCDSQAFTDYPLWIANYVSPADNPGDKKPSVPAKNWGGKGWLLWQHTEKGTILGIKGNVDRNIFNGSPERLLAFVNR